MTLGPNRKVVLLELVVIEHYRRREGNVEEVLIDMYLAVVSTRQVDDAGLLLEKLF